MEQTFLFFKTYLDLCNVQPAKARFIHLVDFRNFILDRLGKTKETVKLLAPYDARAFPHLRLLLDHHDYYVAQDLVTNTYSITFRNLTMVDLDFEGDVQQGRDEYLCFLRHFCDENPTWCFAIFTSRKGLHVFPLHKKMDKEEKVDAQLLLQCDFNYVIYTFIRQGTAIRLNQKRDDSLPLYEFLDYMGQGVPDPDLVDLLKLHFQLQFQFSSVGLSQMT